MGRGPAFRRSQRSVPQRDSAIRPGKTACTKVQGTTGEFEDGTARKSYS